MKKTVVTLMMALLFSLGASVLAQVASAEILGIDETRPRSPELSAIRHDNSVGEVVITVRALDASGNPVAGAEVSWLIKNSKDSPAYVVGSSASMAAMLGRVYKGEDLSVAGGVTNSAGEAYLVVDARTAGDITIVANVAGVAAKTYEGRDMRIVWF